MEFTKAASSFKGNKIGTSHDKKKKKEKKRKRLAPFFVS